MNCRFCNIPQAGQMQFIVGYCWKCLEKARKSSNLPIEVFVELLRDGMEIVK